MEGVTCVIALVLCFLLVKLFFERKSSVRLAPPPGPKGVANSLKFISSSRGYRLHRTCEEWAQEYGDIVNVKVLGGNVVFLNSVDMIRRVLAGDQYKDTCNDRPPSFLAKYGAYGSKNVAAQNYSARWRHQRKIFHSALQTHGKEMEELETVAECEMMRIFEKMKEKGVVDMDKELKTCLLNTLHVVLLGEEVTDPKTSTDIIKNFDLGVNELFDVDVNVVMTMCPIVRFFPGLYKRLWLDFCHYKNQMIEHYLERAKKLYQPGVVRSFLEGLLEHQRRLAKSGDPWLTDEHIVGIIIDFIVAGFLTTSGTLGGFFLLMIKHPDVQSKIQEEIDRVLGKNSPRISDKPNLPYLEAAMLETLRYIRHVPFGLPHMARQDIVIDDYTISAGTMILCNFWLAHHDKRIWNSPEEFRPERFLDDNGDLLSPEHPVRRSFIPFSTGRRQCVGEGFAKNRLFLFLASLLQHFSFFPPPDGKLPSTDSRTWHPGVVLLSPAFSCTLEPR